MYYTLFSVQFLAPGYRDRIRSEVDDGKSSSLKLLFCNHLKANPTSIWFTSLFVIQAGKFCLYHTDMNVELVTWESQNLHSSVVPFLFIVFIDLRFLSSPTTFALSWLSVLHDFLCAGLSTWVGYGSYISSFRKTSVCVRACLGQFQQWM